MKDPEKKKNKKLKGIIVGAALIIVAVILIIFYKTNNIDEEYTDASKYYEPKFVKEGQLAFISKATNDTIKTIDIEIADNEDKRIQGLMWRRSMSDSAGMLFIFGDEEPQAFWMKNTYIPLDIIYINKLMEIVSSRAYATPLSEESIPSGKPAQYVVEVNAGFCYKYKITEGDRIKFKRVK